MKEPKHSILDRSRAARVALALFGASSALLLGACHRSHGHYGDREFVPVYFETEPNDDELTANDFGVLYPGDRFIIDGFCSETDLDGFWFTAGEPIHVDFQLFVASPFPDLDVCLFDPQLGQTVACFETSNDPEAGGVDVTGSGLDFHLVVDSFAGAGSYSLEIEVTSLFFPLEAATGAAQLRAVQPENELTGSALLADSVSSARAANRADFERYAVKRPNVEPSETIVTREVDPLTGESIETTIFREGTRIDSE